MPGFGNAIGIPFIRRKLSGLRAKFRGDGTITAMLDPILRDLSADFVSNGTITAALETIKLLDADFSGEGTVTGELLDFTGLLDDYPNAAAAYSVRLLRADYTGGLVEIRRSSDNATKAFLPDSNNELSLSSEAVVGSQTLGNFVGANDGFVVTWFDQSGNSNDASNSTASEQPQIISSGSLITSNGKSAIDTTSSSRFLNNIAKPSQTAETAITVIKLNNTSGDQRILGYPNGNSARLRLNSGNFSFEDYVVGSPNTFSRATITADTNQNILLTNITNSEKISRIYKNNVQGTDGAQLTGTLKMSNESETNIHLGIARTGSVLPLNAKISEYVRWDSDRLSDKNGIFSNVNGFFSAY